MECLGQGVLQSSSEQLDPCFARARFVVALPCPALSCTYYTTATCNAHTRVCTYDTGCAKNIYQVLGRSPLTTVSAHHYYYTAPAFRSPDRFHYLRILGGDLLLGKPEIRRSLISKSEISRLELHPPGTCPLVSMALSKAGHRRGGTRVAGSSARNAHLKDGPSRKPSSRNAGSKKTMKQVGPEFMLLLRGAIVNRTKYCS